MSPSRIVAVALCLLAALVLQASMLARIPTPGARPDLVLVVVVAFALAKGPLVGLVVGFGAGLLLDLVSVHALGALALVLCVIGYLAGLFAVEVEQSAFIPFVVVAGGPPRPPPPPPCSTPRSACSPTTVASPSARSCAACRPAWPTTRFSRRSSCPRSGCCAAGSTRVSAD